MLQGLSIRNYLILREIDIDFDKGFSVLTGQTGSGKSILLDAIEVVLGQKQVKKDILHASDKDASLSISFNINKDLKVKEFLLEHSLESEEEGILIIRRVLKRNGSQKTYINDHTVSLSILKTLGRMLLDYNSQGDQFKTLNKGSYRLLVDRYGKHENLTEELAEIYNKYIEAKENYDDLKKLEESRKKEIDYLHHNIEEIEKLEIVEGEEEDLDQRRRKFLNSEKLRQTYKEVVEIISSRESSISEQILRAIKALGTSSVPESQDNNEILSRLENSLESLQEAESLIKSQFDNFESEDIDQIQERLFKIREIARKHNCNPSELLQKLEDFKSESDRLEKAEEMCHESEELYKKYEKQFKNLAFELSLKRKKVAEILSKKIIKKLASLDLGKARFVISVDYKKELVSRNGSDTISFEVSMNPGIPLSSVDTTASGGELSRFLLAMKSVLAEHLPVSVLVFDEIDSGVSGGVASAIGKELESLSKVNQLLVVTHSPQIITFADHHYLVQKMHDRNKEYTKSSLKLLNRAEQKEEVARLLSGQKITDKARTLAEEMLQK